MTKVKAEVRSPHFIFYGGKGGVGKTTCAVARALAESSGRRGREARRVLVVSTDPAHSLGDAFGTRLTTRPRRIQLPVRPHRVRSGPARGSLHAVELDAPRAFSRWLAEHRRALADIVEHGSWLDRDDVDALLGLSMPGVDELVGLIEIGRLSKSGRYSLVVVDTAPTGHTLRLLTAPRTVAVVSELLGEMQREHRLIREQLARIGRPEAADRLIDLLAQQARETAALLSDAETTTFHWVMLPEELSLAESEDGLAALDRASVHVGEVIVNRVTPPGGRCAICDRRRAEERRVIAQIARRLGRQRPLRFVTDAAQEPRGVAALLRFGRAVFSGRRSAFRNGERPASTAGQPRTSNAEQRATNAAPRTNPPETIGALLGARLLFFGGKGGVGKTTCAAATAVRLARVNSARRVLLLSTDPAHSLADVFATSVGDRARLLPQAPRNLWVRELDASAALAARRGTLEAAFNEIVSAFGAEGGGLSDHQGVSELMDLAPPGIDELLGILLVVEAESQYDLIILDTAPTGHALRLLEMPDVAREWLQVLMRVLLKYRALVRPGRLAAELVDLSKSIRRLQEMLTNAAVARFIVVTRAADVPRLETRRLIGRLHRLRLATPAIVFNAMTLNPGACSRCRKIAAGERRLLARFTRTARRECAIILTPLAAPPPRGVAQLDRWAGAWTRDAKRRGH